MKIITWRKYIKLSTYEFRDFRLVYSNNFLVETFWSKYKIGRIKMYWLWLIDIEIGNK